MKLSRRPRHAVRLALFALCLSFAPFFAPLAAPSAHAQATQGATGPIVREIDVQYVGRPTVTRERVLAQMRTAIGQPFSQANAEDDIRSLYGTGDVTNVRIFSEPTSGGVKVIVIIQTRATIREVVFNGSRKYSPRKLQKEITSKKGSTLSEENIESDRQKLLDYYRDHSFPDVDIQTSIAMDDRTNTGVVTFTINEGGKSVLRKVIFEGNHAIKERELRGAMKDTKGKTIIALIDKSGRLDQGKLREDLDNVRELYQNKGYVEVEIPETRVVRLASGDIDLVVVVREGPQYHVGTLTFQGTQVFTDAEIRRFLKMKEGAIYSPKGLKDDDKTISDYYGSRGYVDAKVVPEGLPAGSNRVNLTYKIEEGGVSYVERVNISGNRVTKDKVIRREIPLAPGDIFNTVLVESAKKRLENLGYFEKVEADPTDTLVPDRKDLDVAVQEKRTGSLSVGAGFSSIDSLVGTIDLTQANFDITNWPTFTGGGQRFRAQVQYGVTRKDFVLGLTEPYFLDTRLAVGGEAFFHDNNYISNDYDQQNLGFDINVRRALGRFFAGSLEYRFEQVDINNVSPKGSILEQEVGTRERSGVRGGLSYDTRDSVFLTRRGTRVDFAPYVAGGVLGGNTDVFGFDLTASQYFHFPLDTILLLNGEIASVDTLPGGDRVPVFDRLYLGGPNNLRGFGFRKVGPLDYKGNPVGGRSLVRYTVEYTAPIIARVRAAVFTDGGYVNQDSFNFGPTDLYERSDFRTDPNKIDDNPRTPNPNKTKSDLDNKEFGGGFNADVGIGFRLDLPIGPVRFDYGYPIFSNDLDIRRSGKFNFNVGYQF